MQPIKITTAWYNATKYAAERKGWNFRISLKYLQKLFEKQDFKCALSGIRLVIYIGPRNKQYPSHTTASLDRIDNNRGYTHKNVQFVHKDVNMIKWKLDEDYFLELCRKISRYQGTK